MDKIKSRRGGWVCTACWADRELGPFLSWWAAPSRAPPPGRQAGVQSTGPPSRRRRAPARRSDRHRGRQARCLSSSPPLFRLPASSTRRDADADTITIATCVCIRLPGRLPQRGTQRMRRRAVAVRHTPNLLSCSGFIQRRPAADSFVHSFIECVTPYAQRSGGHLHHMAFAPGLPPSIRICRCQPNTSSTANPELTYQRCQSIPAPRGPHWRASFFSFPLLSFDLTT